MLCIYACSLQAARRAYSREFYTLSELRSESLNSVVTAATGIQAARYIVARERRRSAWHENSATTANEAQAGSGTPPAPPGTGGVAAQSMAALKSVFPSSV